MKKIWENSKMVFGMIFLILASVAAFCVTIMLLKKTPLEALEDLKNAIKVKKNPSGTQVLPQTPKLDKTLNDIEKDIINN